MAYLLEQALLGSFSPEQKDHFAQKVFLVVNQMDAIRSSEDRRRLQDSVESAMPTLFLRTSPHVMCMAARNCVISRPLRTWRSWRK